MKALFMRKLLATSLLISITLYGTGNAQFVLVDDFNSLTTGGINGQNGWVSDTATFDVIDSSPASPTDQALQNGSANTFASVGTSAITQGNTGTLYFRLNASDFASGQSIGLSDTVPTVQSGAFDTYRPHIAFNGTGDFLVRDGGGFSTVTNVSLATNTWYDFWMVANNSSETWELYVQGGSITTQTQVAVGATTTFGFRNTTNADLDSFLMVRGGGGNGDTVAVDDIYLDNSSINLANPIPEPSSYALLGIAAFALMFLRKRSKQ
ncbi:MAG: PEP-CTERM sorting domain-containing protein [Verrucomicrobiota bacterium]